MIPTTYYGEYTIVSCNRPHGMPEYFLIFQDRYVSLDPNLDLIVTTSIPFYMGGHYFSTPLPIEYYEHSLDDHFPYLNIKVIKTYSKQEYPEVYI